MIYKIQYSTKKVIKHYNLISEIDIDLSLTINEMYINYGNFRIGDYFYVDDKHNKFKALYESGKLNKEVFNYIKKYKRNLVINDILK